VLSRADAALEAAHYRTHEFGDSVLVFAMPAAMRCRAGGAIACRQPPQRSTIHAGA